MVLAHLEFKCFLLIELSQSVKNAASEFAFKIAKR